MLNGDKNFNKLRNLHKLALG